MRPYVFINSAMSADGKISTVARKQVRISGEDDLRRVDALKANVDAVMIGVGTVLADDPKLTIKSVVLKRKRVDEGRSESKVDLTALLGRLKDRGVESLLVEGGATLNFALLSLGLVDEIYTYVGNIIIGGSAAPTLVDGAGLTNDFVKLNLREIRQIGDGVLIKWRVAGF